MMNNVITSLENMWVVFNSTGNEDPWQLSKTNVTSCRWTGALPVLQNGVYIYIFFYIILPLNQEDVERQLAFLTFSGLVVWSHDAKLQPPEWNYYTE